MIEESDDECCMIILSLRKMGQMQWLKSKTSVGAVSFAQPALKILFRSAASLKISRMYQVRSTLNQCFFEPSGGPSLFIR